MHKTQKDYYEKLQAHIIAVELANTQIDEIAEDDNEDEYISQLDQIEEHYQVWGLYDELRKAEQSLIDWAFSVIKDQPLYARNSVLFSELLFKIEHNVTARKKVVDLAMQLKV